MQYDHIRVGRFLERPNRFIAVVELEGEPVRCHVKNTGRCKELLVPGAQVFLEHSAAPERKTAFDLVAVRKGGRLINIDSQAPNKAAGEWISSGGLLRAPEWGAAEETAEETLTLLRPESRFGNSRFDFYLETNRQKAFLEVKGVTLEEDGIVRFPDAPTERGVKHIEELCSCLLEGYAACLLFVVQMKGVSHFSPNEKTHPAFAEALRKASARGVRILARDCLVTRDQMELRDPVLVKL